MRRTTKPASDSFRAFEYATHSVNVDVEPTMPAKVNWKSHNYTHLMEQPTSFHAAVAILALAGEGSGINASFAWAYVAIRVVHSIWQSTVNIIPVRIAMFTLSTLCLWVLAINAVTATLLSLLES